MSFNNQCLIHILGVTEAQQHIGRITSAEVRRRFGVEEVLEDIVVAKKLRWAGRIACMDDCRLLKMRPAHGNEQRWRDRMRKDLKQYGIPSGSGQGQLVPCGSGEGIMESKMQERPQHML